MDEHQRAQFLRLGPEWVEFWRRGHFAGDVTGDADTAEPLFLDGFFQLLGREVGMLQRD